MSPISTSHQSSPSMPRPFSPTPTFGYICGPVDQEMDDEQESQPIGLRRATLRSTPSSCCSEWEGSLWNGWGSVSESNMASARTSIISSSDCSFINDANFARVLALTAESMSGTLSGKISTLFSLCRIRLFLNYSSSKFANSKY